MKWIEPIVFFFQKVMEIPFLAKYLATREPKMRLGTRKCKGSRDSPHKGNMNWANSFFKKFQKPFYKRTDRQMDEQTSGWIQYTPIPPSVEPGYNEQWRPVDFCLPTKHLILVLILSSKPTFVTWALVWAVMRYLHIAEKVTSMRFKIGWVLRTFQACDKKPMMTLWK